MHKLVFVLSLSLIVLTVRAQSSIYDFKIPSITGTEIDFNNFRGKKILIVNTASESGQASQLAELEQLFQRYKDSGLVVIAFPTNDFSNEIKSNSDINAEYQTDYHISFPIGAKLSVGGSSIAPIYNWLTKKTFNGLVNSEVRADFHKFLIDENGKLASVFSSEIKPLSRFIVGAIKQ